MKLTPFLFFLALLCLPIAEASLLDIDVRVGALDELARTIKSVSEDLARTANNLQLNADTTLSNVLHEIKIITDKGFASFDEGKLAVDRALDQLGAFRKLLGENANDGFRRIDQALLIFNRTVDKVETTVLSVVFCALLGLAIVMGSLLISKLLNKPISVADLVERCYGVACLICVTWFLSHLCINNGILLPHHDLPPKLVNLMDYIGSYCFLLSLAVLVLDLINKIKPQGSPSLFLVVLLMAGSGVYVAVNREPSSPTVQADPHVDLLEQQIIALNKIVADLKSGVEDRILKEDDTFRAHSTNLATINAAITALQSRAHQIEGTMATKSGGLYQFPGEWCFLRRGGSCPAGFSESAACLDTEDDNDKSYFQHGPDGGVGACGFGGVRFAFCCK